VSFQNKLITFILHFLFSYILWWNLFNIIFVSKSMLNNLFSVVTKWSWPQVRITAKPASKKLLCKQGMPRLFSLLRQCLLFCLSSTLNIIPRHSTSFTWSCVSPVAAKTRWDEYRQKFAVQRFLSFSLILEAY